MESPPDKIWAPAALDVMDTGHSIQRQSGKASQGRQLGPGGLVLLVWLDVAGPGPQYPGSTPGWGSTGTESSSAILGQLRGVENLLHGRTQQSLGHGVGEIPRRSCRQHVGMTVECAALLLQVLAASAGALGWGVRVQEPLLDTSLPRGPGGRPTWLASGYRAGCRVQGQVALWEHSAKVWDPASA